MKKKRLFIYSTSLIVGATTILLSLSERDKATNLMKANIEALSAAPQQGPDGNNSGTCYSEIKLNDKYRVLICGSCTFTTGRGTRVGGTCGQ